jgi:hypothetical protein
VRIFLRFVLMAAGNDRQRGKFEYQAASTLSRAMLRPSLRPLRLSARQVSIAGILSLAAAFLLWRKSPPEQLGFLAPPPPASAAWDSQRDEVRDAFVNSWAAYSKYAWGKAPSSNCSSFIDKFSGQDQFHPIQQTGPQMSEAGLGWIIVDSLDTMMIMNLTSQLSDAREWVFKTLTWDQDRDVNTFETTIRMLGGLLAAHYLSKKLPYVSSPDDEKWLKMSVDLGDRLLNAYKSNSGIPYSGVNLRNGVVSAAPGGASTAEASTLQLEMKYLSHLTGKEEYWRKAENVLKVIDNNGPEAGLVPIFVSPETGKFVSSEIRLGSRGDSYYGISVPLLLC